MPRLTKDVIFGEELRVYDESKSRIKFTVNIDEDVQ